MSLTCHIKMFFTTFRPSLKPSSVTVFHGCLMDFDNGKVVGNEPNYHQRLFLEKANNDDTFNSELPQIYFSQSRSYRSSKVILNFKSRVITSSFHWNDEGSRVSRNVLKNIYVLQVSERNLSIWFRKNKLITNSKKGNTESMIFWTAKRLNRLQRRQLNLMVNRLATNSTTSYQYLGEH